MTAHQGRCGRNIGCTHDGKLQFYASFVTVTDGYGWASGTKGFDEFDPYKLA
jgi:hypothetical protein